MDMEHRNVTVYQPRVWVKKKAVGSLDPKNTKIARYGSVFEGFESCRTSELAAKTFRECILDELSVVMSTFV